MLRYVSVSDVRWVNGKWRIAIDMVGTGNEITKTQSGNLSRKTEKNQEKTSVSKPRFE